MRKALCLEMSSVAACWLLGGGGNWVARLGIWLWGEGQPARGSGWGAGASSGFWKQEVGCGVSRLGTWVALDTGRVWGQALSTEAHIGEGEGAAELPGDAPRGGDV